MAPSRHLAALAALACLASAIEGRQVSPKRLAHQRRGLISPRQGNGGIIPISIPDGNEATPSSRGGAAVTTSPPAGPTTSSVQPIIEITISSPAASVVTTSSVAPVTVTSSSTLAASTTARSTVRQVTSQTTVGNSIINVTLTSTVDLPSTSASAVAQQQDTSSQKSGIGKGTLIAIIVVASSCAGVFILWTIFRRWKLKPTRNFEERLQPIDFGPGEKAAYEPMSSQTSLNRNGSLGSNGSAGEKPVAGLRRQDSFGSAMGSQRGGGSVRGGPAGSEIGSRTGGYAPSYPPSNQGGWNGYAQQVPAHQVPYNAPSPPRLANPYGSDYGATHGVARSDTIQSSQYGGGHSAYGRYN